MMKELFSEFNKRYDDLNDDLQMIHDEYKTTDEFKNAENHVYLKNKVIAFFNLCAEEYFWYEKGRIDESVWRSWNVGMKVWYKIPTVHDLWIEETKDGGLTSYYVNNNTKGFFE